MKAWPDEYETGQKSHSAKGADRRTTVEAGGAGLEMDLAVTHSRRGRKVSSGPDSGEGGLLQLSVALKLLATVTHQPDILHYSVSDIFRLFAHTMRFTRLRHTEAA